MNTQKFLKIGGLIAGVLMIAFGVGSLALGINARNVVTDELSTELIVGSPDMKPHRHPDGRHESRPEQHPAPVV